MWRKLCSVSTDVKLRVTPLGFQVDRFTIEAVDLGQVFKIRIRHDNSMVGADWYLDQVEVQDVETEEVYMFLCERWLSKKKEDKQTERTFFVKVCFTLCNNTNKKLPQKWKSNIRNAPVPTFWNVAQA